MKPDKPVRGNLDSSRTREIPSSNLGGGIFSFLYSKKLPPPATEIFKNTLFLREETKKEAIKDTKMEKEFFSSPDEDDLDEFDESIDDLELDETD